ncbi:hypothetical protein Tco_1062373, partial [Tanacetum coccineum]
KVKVNVILEDRESNKLIFSRKPKEKGDAVARKKNLMAKLSVGDVVNCCVKKITYYGIFVEVFKAWSKKVNNHDIILSLDSKPLEETNFLLGEAYILLIHNEVEDASF